MRLCINEQCSEPENSDDSMYCKACSSELLINGAYRVIKKLGEGGFGKTYEVLDSNNQSYVLKIIKLDEKNNEKNNEVIKFFNREVAALKQIRCDGIPKYCDDFEFQPVNSEQKFPCLVMEKIQGENLSEWMEKQNNPINETRAIDWLYQLAQIVHKVHEQKLFHRDINPSNIMLNTQGTLILVDFGLARFLDKEYEEDYKNGKVTRHYTPGYADNEQKSGYATPQSDFASLGYTLIYLLTGKEPRDLTEKSFNNHTGTKFNWREHALLISEDLLDFVDRLIDQNKKNRPKNTLEILEFIEVYNSSKDPENFQKTLIKSNEVGKITAKVAKVIDEYKLIINKGSIDGIQINQRIKIYGSEQQVKDPDTGVFLGYSGKPKGVGIIVSVEDKIATLISDQYSKSGSYFLGEIKKDDIFLHQPLKDNMIQRSSSKTDALQDVLQKIKDMAKPPKRIPFNNPTIGDFVEFI